MSSADLVGRLERVVLQCGNEWYYTPLVYEALAEIKRLSKELAETQGHLAIRNSDLLDEQLRHGRTAQAARRELATAESRALSIEAETREACAAKAEAWSRPDIIGAVVGRMTDQELRTAQATAWGIATAIRASASTKGERS